MLPTKEDWRRAFPSWLRGSAIGFGFGLLPGPSATLSSFVSYRVEKGVSKHRDDLGKGAVEGVAGPEAANNAAAISSLVPLLALGLPFSATFALVISAMIVQGIQPGPLLIEQHPDVFWGLLVSMYVANVMLLVLNLPLVGMWVSILRISKALMLPGIIMIAFIGAFGTRNSFLDLWVLLGAGVTGFWLRKLGFNMASFILGLVLGPLVEKHLREGLFSSRGDIGYLVDSPIAMTIWVIVGLVTFGGPIWRRVRPRSMAKLPLTDADD